MWRKKIESGIPFVFFSKEDSKWDASLRWQDGFLFSANLTSVIPAKAGIHLARVSGPYDSYASQTLGAGFPLSRE